MDDRKLDVLIAAIEEGSLNKAAARCRCTQSAATQAVNAIEAELGCKVLERSHSGVRPTEAGDALLPLAREAREALLQLQRAADNMARKDNTVCLGSYPSIVQTWLPGAVSAYTRVNPSVMFDIRIGSNDLADLLVEGAVGVVLCDDWLFEEAFSGYEDNDYRIAGRSDGSKVSWHPLADDPFCAVVPANMKHESCKVIGRDELFEQPFIFDTKYVFARYLSSEVSSIVKVSVDDNASILSMVAGGMGVTVLPKLSLRNIPEEVAVLELDPPGKRTIGAILPPHASRTVRSFVEFLVGYVA